MQKHTKLKILKRRLVLGAEYQQYNFNSLSFPHGINKFMYDKNSSEDNVDLDWTKEKEADENCSCILTCRESNLHLIYIQYFFLLYSKRIKYCITEKKLA